MRADPEKTLKSKNYRGSASFATFLIIGPTCFFLGILFASFPYDFPLLWSKAPLPPNYLDTLETHLRFMHQSPPLIGRLLNLMIFTGFTGFLSKLFRPHEANILFDGSSLLLYLIATGIYATNIVKGLRAASGPGGFEGSRERHEGPFSGEVELSREDSLRVLSASHTILAIVLVGILTLQAGQWYAEKAAADESEELENKEKERKRKKN
ncbi:Shr3 amino acid permease chaperone [Podospora fimiseda]|uniref:Shr3 amino acid permease chaperone n=1 Tax=Podospora fimiseda TaxID=252190 RepID=A0AAN7BMN0_9PEZI|nr:Shr3 amino acid permease chaperone [Podospora fimiseda]